MELVVAAAGAALGGAIAPGVVAFGLTGSAIGWQAGLALGGALFAPTQKIQGPRLGDLSVSGSSYGQVIPYVEGHPRIGGQIIWASSKREIATTTRHGKGGGGSKVTTYTYEVDLLIELTDCQLDGILRIFSNGELVFSQSATATIATLQASVYTSLWNRLTFYGGGPTQLPDPDYEAAVGTDNAPAYRGRGTVFIKSLQLGQSGQLPNLTFEVVRSGSSGISNAFYYENVSGTINPTGDPSFYVSSTYKYGTSAFNANASSGQSIGGTAAVRNTIWEALLGPVTYEAWVYLTAYPSETKTLFGIGKGLHTAASHPSFAASAHHALAITPGGFLCPILYSHDYNGVTDSGGGPTAYDLPPSSGGAGTGPWNGDDYWVSDWLNPSLNPNQVPLNTWVHLVLQREGNGNWGTLVNGASHVHSWPVVASASRPNTVTGPQPAHPNYWPQLEIAAQINQNPTVPSSGVYSIFSSQRLSTVSTPFVGSNFTAVAASIDSFRISSVDLYDGDIYELQAPTNDFAATADTLALFKFDSYPTLAADDPTVATVVSRLCTERAGLDASQFSVTALSGITTPVHGMAISQVSSVRAVLEMLMGCYFFDAVLSDKLYFYPRAGSAAKTLPYEDLGWTAEGSSVDPFPLITGSEIELPAQLALSYSNIDADYQTDTQYSDRIHTAQENTQVVQVPLGLTAAEAKVIVDARLADMLVALTTSKIHLDLNHANLEPTDVVLVTAENGSVFRNRLLKRTDTDGVLQFDIVADDATVFSQLGLTTGGTDSQTSVVPVPDTVMELMDIPILRDADNQPGFYIAVKGDGPAWFGASIYYSFDDVSYLFDDSTPVAAVFGTCMTALDDWTRGAVFDEWSTVQVNIDTDELESTTREALLNSETANAALIGNELVQFRTAELVSTGIYNLTGFLRGRRGTEWAATGHTSSDRFVLLNSTSLRFAVMETGELGRLQYRKAATTGQRLSAVPSETFTPTGVGLKPYSPVYLAANRDAADTILTWIRRTRLSTRFGGPTVGSAPLGEESERYEVEIYTASDFVTVARTISATVPEVVYTAAQQTADFGSQQTVLHVKVYQVSAIVGRGYALTKSV